jgi:hypothetical protein
MGPRMHSESNCAVKAPKASAARDAVTFSFGPLLTSDELAALLKVPTVVMCDTA